MEVYSSMFGNNLLMNMRSMDYLWVKQTATVNNLANVDTPNYKAKRVSFEEEFKKRLDTASGSGSETVRSTIMGSKYHIYDDETESARADGNNVNTDLENVELVRTALQYQYEINAYNSDVTRLRSVIKG